MANLFASAGYDGEQCGYLGVFTQWHGFLSSGGGDRTLTRWTKHGRTLFLRIFNGHSENCICRGEIGDFQENLEYVFSKDCFCKRRSTPTFSKDGPKTFNFIDLY